MRLRRLRLVLRRRWPRLLLVVLAPLFALNVAVAFFGDTTVFPLSPYHLGNKARALGRYFLHRPTCLFGHAELAPIVARAETRHGLPRGLLAALVQIESSGRVHRISPTGAMGPGQIMPGTARQLGVADPFDPEEALDGSARYLAAQLARFRDVRLALAAYNAGPGAIVGRRVPRNGETEFYVTRVIAAWRPRQCLDTQQALRRSARAGPVCAERRR